MFKALAHAETAGRNAALDGLRAVSVLLVIVSHLTWAAPLSWLSASGKVFVENLGQLGVECFFGISGFIITRILLAELQNRGRVSLGAFYVRRICRIIPAYWMYLFFVLELAWLGEIGVDRAAFVQSLLFISNLPAFPAEHGWFVGHSWTLSQEEQYYVLFPIVFWTLLKGKRRWLGLAMMVLYAVTVYENRIVRVDPSFDTSHLVFLTWFKYIIAGVLLALIWEQGVTLFRKIPIVIPLVVVLLLATRCFYTGSEHLTVTKYVQATEAIGMVFVIGWLVGNPGQCGFLDWQAVQWLGRSSYSFYLWQQLYTGEPSLYGSIVLSRLPMALVMLAGTATVFYYLIEKPFIRLGKRLSAQLGQPASGGDQHGPIGLLEEEEAPSRSQRKTETVAIL